MAQLQKTHPERYKDLDLTIHEYISTTSSAPRERDAVLRDGYNMVRAMTSEEMEWHHPKAIVRNVVARARKLTLWLLFLLLYSSYPRLQTIVLYSMARLLTSSLKERALEFRKTGALLPQKMRFFICMTCKSSLAPSSCLLCEITRHQHHHWELCPLNGTRLTARPWNPNAREGN